MFHSFSRVHTKDFIFMYKNRLWIENVFEILCIAKGVAFFFLARFPARQIILCDSENYSPTKAETVLTNLILAY